MDICSLPQLIAAYHVFHRLSVPRHPPYALYSLCKILFHKILQARSLLLLVGLRGLEPPTSRLSGVRSNHLSYKPMLVSASGRRFRLPTPCGGDEEDRTPDPLLARQVLSQLSYTPK